jgi:hypothetical protein
LYESYSKNNGVFIEYMDSLPLGDNNLRGRIQAKQTLSLMADIFYEIQRRVLQLTYETFA